MKNRYLTGYKIVVSDDAYNKLQFEVQTGNAVGQFIEYITATAEKEIKFEVTPVTVSNEKSPAEGGEHKNE